jgi:phage gpG-like protein
LAKRRSKEQIQSDRIIRRRLVEFGELVREQAIETSRVAKDTFYKTDRVKPKGTIMRAGGELRDSPNFRMINDTTLLIVQTYYGAFNFPKGETSGEKNALLIAINENLKDNVDLIAKEVLAEIVGPWQI